MKTTVWIVGDQLNPHISALRGLPPSECVVLMIESLAAAQRLPYHKHKLVLVWSAMRHFAQEIGSLGYSVDYYPAQPSLRPALEAHIRQYRPARFRLMETAEYRRAARLARLLTPYQLDVEITPNCCQHCEYDYRQKAGQRACPFNVLYWDFLARNRDQLRGNQRLSLTLAALDRRNAGEVQAIRVQAAELRGKLQRKERV